MSILPYLSKVSPLKVIISITAYLFSHFLRSLRVAVMIGRQDFSFIRLIDKQFYTNGINLIIPFKLGEVYRIVEFSKIFKNSERTFLTILAERTMDFLFLFLGLFFALYVTDYNVVNLHFTVMIGSLFIGFVLFLYYVLPENLRSLNLFLAKRYTTKNVNRILSVSDKFYSIIINIKQIIKRKSSTIVLLTILIWCFEIAGLFFIIDFLPEWHYLLLLAFFVFLSSLIPSASLGLGGLQIAFYLISTIKIGFPYFAMSVIYQLCIFLPAILISFVLYLIHKLFRQKEKKMTLRFKS